MDNVLAPGTASSILLDISLSDQYVQTRWNMVGELRALPWKPKIDVIGNTRFWYNQIQQDDDDDSEDSCYYQVYFYDEEWEIPAANALLQLVTPAGTIANSSASKRS